MLDWVTKNGSESWDESELYWGGGTGTYRVSWTRQRDKLTMSSNPSSGDGLRVSFSMLDDGTLVGITYGPDKYLQGHVSYKGVNP